MAGRCMIDTTGRHVGYMIESGARRFVGRDAELELVLGMLTDRAARPAFVVVEGDPGIGKTRLLAEIADRASRLGVDVRTGCATQFERTMPFAMVLDAFGHTLADDGEPEAPAAASRRYRRYQLVRGELAAGGPALLVFDDVQWADPSSLELLTYLVSNPPPARVLMLLACRSVQCPPRLLAALGRQRPHLRWLRLGPLGAADVERLLPNEPAARRELLYRGSGGNPLYLELLAREPDHTLTELARHPARLTDQTGDVLDRAIAAELRALDGTVLVVAQAAALLGGDADLDLLARVAQVDPTEVATAVDALTARDVLRCVDGRLAFRHPLVRAAAYRIAGPGWRLRAHERAAAYLRRHRAPPAQQAQHLEFAARLGDGEAAETLAAAAQAVLDSAPATSARWLRAALRILPGDPDQLEHTERRAWLRVLLAEALVLSGQLAAGQAELHDLSGLTGRVRASAVRLLAVTARLQGDLAAASALTRGELGRATNPAVQVMLRIELLTDELLRGRWDDAARVAATLGSVADGSHPGVRAVAATLRTLGSVPGGRLDQLLDRLATARAFVDGLDDGALRDVLDVVVPLSWLELLVDQTGQASRHLDRGLRLAHRYGRAYVIPQLYPIRSLVHCRVGAVSAALREAQDAEDAARAVGSAEMVAFAKAVRLRPLWCSAGPAAAAHAVAELDDGARLGSTWHRLVADHNVAEVLLAIGRSEDCRGRLLPWQRDLGQLGPLAPGQCAVLSHSFLADGDLAGARRWLERAGEALGSRALAGQRGAVAHVEATIMLAEHLPAAAVSLASAAVDHFESVGLAVRAAQARTTLAEALLRDGQVPAARRELGSAKEALAEAGAGWLAAEAERAQRRLGARLPRNDRSGATGRPTTRLTTREREIAELVTQGLTNREIATRLYLSPRTVDAHLGRILAKLEVHSRAAVARRMAD
jgi:DNA-binding NarL/FixJ family response regulator